MGPDGVFGTQVDEPSRAGFDHVPEPSRLPNELGHLRDHEAVVEQAAGRARPTDHDGEGTRDDGDGVVGHAAPLREPIERPCHPPTRSPKRRSSATSIRRSGFTLLTLDRDLGPREVVFVHAGTRLGRWTSARATWQAASWLGATSPS